MIVQSITSVIAGGLSLGVHAFLHNNYAAGGVFCAGLIVGNYVGQQWATMEQKKRDFKERVRQVNASRINAQQYFEFRGTKQTESAYDGESQSSQNKVNRSDDTNRKSHPAHIESALKLMGLDTQGNYSPQSIKHAYHKKVRLLHPDLNGNSTLNTSQISSRIKKFTDSKNTLVKYFNRETI